MHELFLEPLKYYEQHGRAAFEEKTAACFDDLLARSKIDAQANRAEVAAYKSALAQAESVGKRLTRRKVGRVFLILGMIAAYALIALHPALAVVSVGLTVLGILLLVKKLNPAIRDITAVRDKHLAEAEAHKAEAERLIAPLLALFDDTIPYSLIEQVIPEFAFERYCSAAVSEELQTKHGFCEFTDTERSAVGTVSGRFLQNPFLYCRRLVHEMREATYEGHLTITWTETYRDSNGKMQTRTRSQVLTAHVTKPKPEFFHQTSLVFGSQAAPDLSFDRTPQHHEKESERALERKVEKGAKKLARKARRDTAGGFQEMANAEFDVLFGASDRDHEVQFRLMFTPLAQCNLVDLMTSKAGFGDDFRFEKRKRYNVITSEHAQSRSFSTAPSTYFSFDVDELRLKFFEFQTGFFKSVFFDFAPLFSVPAYVEEPANSLDPIDSDERSVYAHEIMANAIGMSAFAHPESETSAILKTSLSSRSGDTDTVTVSAFSYRTEPRCDYVPVLGGDGRYHNVPVEWREYFPLSHSAKMSVRKTKQTERDYSSDPAYSGEIYIQGMLGKRL